MGFEVRWIERNVPRKRGIDDGFYSPPLPEHIIVRVLQFRQNDNHVGVNWSEWQDVPTISASAMEADSGEGV